jgi:hypothetical protein
MKRLWSVIVVGVLVSLVWVNLAAAATLPPPSVAGNWPVYGKIKVTVSAMGHSESATEYGGNVYHLNADGTFAEGNGFDGSWFQKKYNYTINFDPVPVEQFFSDMISYSGLDVADVTVRKMRSTGKLSKDGSAIKGKTELSVLMDVPFEGKIYHVKASGVWDYASTSSPVTTSTLPETAEMPESDSMISIMSREALRLIKKYKE